MFFFSLKIFFPYVTFSNKNCDDDFECFKKTNVYKALLKSNKSQVTMDLLILYKFLLSVISQKKGIVFLSMCRNINIQS